MAVKTIVHVNQHVIKANKKRDVADAEPCLTVKTYKDNRYADEAIILDEHGAEVARVVYRPHKPLSCGAHCWIETRNRVVTKLRGAEQAARGVQAEQAEQAASEGNPGEQTGDGWSIPGGRRPGSGGNAVVFERSLGAKDFVQVLKDARGGQRVWHVRWHLPAIDHSEVLWTCESEQSAVANAEIFARAALGLV